MSFEQLSESDPYDSLLDDNINCDTFNFTACQDLHILDDEEAEDLSDDIGFCDEDQKEFEDSYESTSPLSIQLPSNTQADQIHLFRLAQRTFLAWASMRVTIRNQRRAIVSIIYKAKARNCFRMWASIENVEEEEETLENQSKVFSMSPRCIEEDEEEEASDTAAFESKTSHTGFNSNELDEPDSNNIANQSDFEAIAKDKSPLNIFCEIGSNQLKLNDIQSAVKNNYHTQSGDYSISVNDRCFDSHLNNQFESEHVNDHQFINEPDYRHHQLNHQPDEVNDNYNRHNYSQHLDEVSLQHPVDILLSGRNPFPSASLRGFQECSSSKIFQGFIYEERQPLRSVQTTERGKGSSGYQRQNQPYNSSNNLITDQKYNQDTEVNEEEESIEERVLSQQSDWCKHPALSDESGYFPHPQADQNTQYYDSNNSQTYNQQEVEEAENTIEISKVILARRFFKKLRESFRTSKSVDRPISSSRVRSHSQSNSLTQFQCFNPSQRSPSPLLSSHCSSINNPYGHHHLDIAQTSLIRRTFQGFQRYSEKKKRKAILRQKLFNFFEVRYIRRPLNGWKQQARYLTAQKIGINIIVSSTITWNLKRAFEEIKKTAKKRHQEKAIVLLLARHHKKITVQQQQPTKLLDKENDGYLANVYRRAVIPSSVLKIEEKQHHRTLSKIIQKTPSYQSIETLPFTIRSPHSLTHVQVQDPIEHCFASFEGDHSCSFRTNSIHDLALPLQSFSQSQMHNELSVSDEAATDESILLQKSNNALSFISKIKEVQHNKSHQTTDTNKSSSLLFQENVFPATRADYHLQQYAREFQLRKRSQEARAQLQQNNSSTIMSSMKPPKADQQKPTPVQPQSLIEKQFNKLKDNASFYINPATNPFKRSSVSSIIDSNSTSIADDTLWHPKANQSSVNTSIDYHSHKRNSEYTQKLRDSLRQSVERVTSSHSQKRPNMILSQPVGIQKQSSAHTFVHSLNGSFDGMRKRSISMTQEQGGSIQQTGVNNGHQRQPSIPLNHQVQQMTNNKQTSTRDRSYNQDVQMNNQSLLESRQTKRPCIPVPPAPIKIVAPISNCNSNKPSIELASHRSSRSMSGISPQSTAESDQLSRVGESIQNMLFFEAKIRSKRFSQSRERAQNESIELQKKLEHLESCIAKMNSDINSENNKNSQLLAEKLLLNQDRQHRSAYLY